jgi:hypothetical protein
MGRVRNLALLASCLGAIGALMHCSSNGSTGGQTTGDAGAPEASLADQTTAPDAQEDVSSEQDASDQGASGDADATSSPDGRSDAGGDSLSDPVPASCDAGGMPPVVGGTSACPDDENRQGCPCSTPDASASCWPGDRDNRGHGTCTDGTTVCQQQGNQLVWGSCQGAVLPTTGGAAKAACACFSTGDWSIANLTPCFYFSDAAQTTVTALLSSLPGAGSPTCPNDPSQTPTVAWSTDTLEVDCTGAYTLCYTLKAGDPSNPKATDCTAVRVCAGPQHYAPAGSTQPLPPLPGWKVASSALACAQQVWTSGGYGELSVQGQSDLCEPVERTLGSISYCPGACNGPNPPPSCATCRAGGGGAF